jgi:hypothetical protein
MYEKRVPNFKADKQQANKVENQLKAILENYWECTINTSQDKGAFSDWDLEVIFKNGEPNLYIEVKQDNQVNKYGNIAVEIGRVVNGQWRDTCLSATKSDAYAYYFNNTFHLIDTPVLKQLYKDKKYKSIKPGGDGMRARNALFPVELFLQHTAITLTA